MYALSNGPLPETSLAANRLFIALPIAAIILSSVSAYQGSEDKAGQSIVVPGSFPFLVQSGEKGGLIKRPRGAIAAWVCVEQRIT